MFLNIKHVQTTLNSQKLINNKQDGFGTKNILL